MYSNTRYEKKKRKRQLSTKVQDSPSKSKDQIRDSDSDIYTISFETVRILSSLKEKTYIRQKVEKEMAQSPQKHVYRIQNILSEQNVKLFAFNP